MVYEQRYLPGEHSGWSSNSSSPNSPNHPSGANYSPRHHRHRSSLPQNFIPISELPASLTPPTNQSKVSMPARKSSINHARVIAAGMDPDSGSSSRRSEWSKLSIAGLTSRRQSKNSMRRKGSIRISHPHKYNSTSLGPNNTTEVPVARTKSNSSSKNKSGVMLVRRKTTSVKLKMRKASSKLKRFFFKVMRKRSKAKFNFTKQSLQRQLSFEVHNNPNAVSKFEIKSIELFKLRPTPKQTIPTGSQAVIETPGNTPPDNIQYSPLAEIASPRPKKAGIPSILDEEKPLEDDAGVTIPHPQPQENQGYQQRRYLPLPVKEDGDRSKELPATPSVNEEPAAHRVPSIRLVSSQKRRSTAPVIERSEIRDGIHSIRDQTYPSKFDNPDQLEEAIEFVNTWSTYLQQAIAVRVVLRKEIHSIEVREEERYSTYRSSFDDQESLYSLSSDVSSTTTISDVSDDSSSSGDAKQSAKSFNSTTQTRSSSSSAPKKHYANYGQIAEKYSALVGDSQAKINRKQVRSSTDSVLSFSRPSKESAWFGQQRRNQQPALPEDSHMQRSVSDFSLAYNRNQKSEFTSSDTERSLSDKILRNMYRELEELQQKSARLSEIVGEYRGPYGDDSSIRSTGSLLRRGKVNRRRPRSFHPSERVTSFHTPWKNTASDTSGSRGSNETESFPSEDTEHLQNQQGFWRRSSERYPTLLQG